MFVENVFYLLFFFFFFFNDTATTEIYTLSLHDALPILTDVVQAVDDHPARDARARVAFHAIRYSVLHHRRAFVVARSEEHTSELQSRLHLVCRLLLEKKKKSKMTHSD